MKFIKVLCIVSCHLMVYFVTIEFLADNWSGIDCPLNLKWLRYLHPFRQQLLLVASTCCLILSSGGCSVQELGAAERETAAHLFLYTL